MDHKKDFYQTLRKLSSHISSNSLLDALKNHCQDVLSEYEMNSIMEPLQLFQALEEHGKLSVNNMQYLTGLFIAVGKPDLAEMLNGSVNSIHMRPHSSYAIQQPADGLSCYNNYTASGWNHPQMENCAVYNTATPPLDTIEEKNHSLPWEASGTRNASPYRYSAEVVIPVCQQNFMPAASVSLDPIKSSSDQWQWENSRNTSEQSSKIPHEQEESARYKTESLSAHSFHQEHGVEIRSEGCHSLPTGKYLHVQQQKESSLPSSTSQHSNHSQLSAAFNTMSLTKTVNQQKEPSMPTQVFDDDDDDDDITTAYPCNTRSCLTVGRLNVSLAQTMRTGVQYRNDHTMNEYQVVQELRSLNEKMQNYERTMAKLVKANTQSRPQFNLINESYQMDKNPHGIALIINNHIFHSNNPNDKPMPNRRGSQVDEEKLCFIWKYLLYETLVVKNCTASELIDELKKIASLNHEKYDSFVCCILSHGCSEGVYGADSQPVNVLEDIVSPFEGNHCPTLAGKPKLFFIQACRGEDEDEGVSLHVVEKDGKYDTKDHLQNSLPNVADFLLGYATPPGKVSWRSQQFGSWYIAALHQVFYDYALHQDLLSMLTIVNREVSEAYTRQGYKQCPAPVSLLRKQVWFFKNYYASSIN